MDAARRRRRPRAAAVPVVDPGQVHEGGADGAARRGREAHRARHSVAHARRPRRRAGARAGGAGAADAGRDAGARGDRGGRARAADAGRRRGAGAVVAALRRDLRLRAPARAALPLARAVAEEVPARAARRPGAAGRRRLGDRVARGAGALHRRRSRACCGPAAARCWWSATASSTAAPRTRPTGSRRPARAVGPGAGRARVTGAARCTTAGWRGLRERPRREHLLLLQKSLARSAPALEKPNVVDRHVDAAAVRGAGRDRELPLDAGQPRLSIPIAGLPPIGARRGKRPSPSWASPRPGAAPAATMILAAPSPSDRTWRRCGRCRWSRTGPEPAPSMLPLMSNCTPVSGVASMQEESGRTGDEEIRARGTGPYPCPRPRE